MLESLLLKDADTVAEQVVDTIMLLERDDVCASEVERVCRLLFDVVEVKVIVKVTVGVGAGVIVRVSVVVTITVPL